MKTTGTPTWIWEVAVNDEALNQKIDDAYRQKYGSSPYMQHMIGAGSCAATVEILPRQ